MGRFALSWFGDRAEAHGYRPVGDARVEFAQHQDHARDQGGILVEDGISVRRELVRPMRFKIEEPYERANENRGSIVLRKPAQGRRSERHGLPEAAHPRSHAVVRRFLVAGQEQWPVSNGAIDFQLVRCCSLIPGLDVKLSTTFLAGSTVLSAVGACPSHDGVR